MPSIQEELLNTIHSGQLILTANDRQTRFLLKEYSRAVEHQLITDPIEPNVHAYRHWLLATWNTFTEKVVDDSAPLLISNHQAQLIWEFTGERVHFFDDILFRTQSAALASSAHRLVEEWCLHDDVQLGVNGNPDAERFVQWMSAFKKHCANNRWFDESCLSRLISDVFAQHIVGAPEQVHLYHFAEVTPQQQLVFDVLTRLGSNIHHIKSANINASIQRIKAEDNISEIRRSAQWCKDILGEMPEAKIAIVVPDLEKHSGQIVRTFDQVLTPGSILNPLGPMERVYNISLGKPLIKQPVIKAAVMVLGMIRGWNTVPEWHSLLHSPFLIGGTSELLARSGFSQYLKSKHRDRFSVAEIIDELAAISSDDEQIACPALLDALKAFQELRMQVTEDYLTRDYPALFRSMLECFGWPGERDTNSIEYQAMKAFENTLDMFNELATVKHYSSISDVLAYLKRITFETLFQPQTPDTPIDIMGVLEAEGMAYDFMWILGAHDEAWPAKSKPNPLLPITVQRSHNIARSCPEREYEFARLITQSLVAGARHVVVSYPGLIDQLYQRVSPFFLNVQEVQPEQISANPTLYSETLIGTAAMELIADTHGPSISDGELIEGGVSIIKHQAACPFRAFAEHRLGAVVNDGGEFSLSHSERGDLMHRTLELIWKELKHQSVLLAASVEDQESLVEQSANIALDEMAAGKDCLNSPAYRELELDRITKLSLQWLVADSKRAPFINVMTEKKTTVSIGGINIRVRIDRQDTLEDGTLAITDYKSTAPSTTALFGSRPEEPQLPIYAVTRPSRQPVGAVMFGQVKTGEAGYKGIANTQGVINEKSKAFAESRESTHAEQWESIVPAWGDTIQTIAASFKNGEASATPKSPRSCEYCQLSALCRISEKKELARFQSDDNLIVRTA